MSDTIKMQAVVPVSVHRAAMVYAAQNATTLGAVVTDALCVKIGLQTPEIPKRGANARLHKD